MALPARAPLAFAECVVASMRAKAPAIAHLLARQRVATVIARAWRADSVGTGALRCCLLGDVLGRLWNPSEVQGCVRCLRRKFLEVLRAVVILYAVDVVDDFAGQQGIVRVRLVPDESRSELLADLDASIGHSPASAACTHRAGPAAKARGFVSDVVAGEGVTALVACSRRFHRPDYTNNPHRRTAPAWGHRACLAGFKSGMLSRPIALRLGREV